MTIFHLAHVVTSLQLSRCTVDYILIGSIFSASLRPLQYIKLYTQFKRIHVNIHPTAFQDIEAFSQVMHPWPWGFCGSYSDQRTWLSALLESPGHRGPYSSFHPSGSTERVALTWLLGTCVGFGSTWPIHTMCSRKNRQRYPPHTHSLITLRRDKPPINRTPAPARLNPF